MRDVAKLEAHIERLHHDINAVQLNKRRMKEKWNRKKRQAEKWCKEAKTTRADLKEVAVALERTRADQKSMGGYVISTFKIIEAALTRPGVAQLLEEHRNARV